MALFLLSFNQVQASIRANHSINMPIKRLSESTASSAIRHEMTHLNDSKFCSENVIDGIDFNDIKQTRKYKSELEAAGISGYSLEYAYKDKKEFIAVAATGDHREYSKKLRLF